MNFLQTQPRLSGRQARWLEFLAELDFAIVHRLGKSNVVADALSRLNNIEVQELGVVNKGIKGKTYSRDWNKHTKMIKKQKKF